MRFRERFWKIGGIAVFLVNVYFCSLKPYVRPVPDAFQEQKSDYIESLTSLYPQRYSAVQRIVLQIRDRHYDFLGHLAMSRNDVFRATAFGDMGGKMLDLYVKEGRVEIIGNHMKLPEKAIVNGVVEDIRHVFDIQIGMNSYLARKEDGVLSLVNLFDSGQFSEYCFLSEKKEMILSRSVSSGEVVREVRYENYSDFEGFPQPLPGKILLKNHRWRYELEIRLLRISAAFKVI